MSFGDTIRYSMGGDRGEQVLVFAKDKRQFNRFIGLNKHNTRGYRYIGGEINLRGVRIGDFRIVTLKGYQNRTDFIVLDATFQMNTGNTIEEYVAEQRIAQMEAKWAKEDAPMFGVGGIVSAASAMGYTQRWETTGTHNLTLPEGRYHISDSMRGLHADGVVIDEAGFNGSVNDLLRAAQPIAQMDTPTRETDIVTLPTGERIQGSHNVRHGERYTMYVPDGMVTQVSMEDYHQLSHMDVERRDIVRSIEENQRQMGTQRLIVPRGTDLGSF